MSGLRVFKLADACRRLVSVGLLLTTHFVVGLSTKRRPNPFTKHATLPSLDTIPTPSDNIPEMTRDYTRPISLVYTNDLESAKEWVDENLGPSSVENPVVLGWDMESSPYLPWVEHKYTKDTYYNCFF